MSQNCECVQRQTGNLMTFSVGFTRTVVIIKVKLQLEMDKKQLENAYRPCGVLSLTGGVLFNVLFDIRR